MNPNLISSEALQRALSLRDLTDPAGGMHAMQLLLDAVVSELRRAWRCPAIVHRAHPVVWIADNYDRLGYPPDGAVRDARYTRYVSATSVLRTQTSAMIPGLLRALAAAPPADALLVCPGLVYRRDQIDRHHVGEPHQVDLWRLHRGALGEEDLDTMIASVVSAALPGVAYRCLPAKHPYTQAGRQVDVRFGEQWLEVGECGLASPRVLRESGLADGVSGLAMGLGLDRLVMLRKGIGDIRLLRATDPRVASQMHDLSPYRPMSSLPPIRRDLSIAVSTDRTLEELGDRAREALAEDADCVEAVELAGEASHASLPPRARERLGMTPWQKNMLLRVVLRHPTRTMTHAEANRLRDRVYAAVHEGTAWQWAGADAERSASRSTEKSPAHKTT